VVIRKEDTPEDLSRRTDKGKSSHAFSVGNQVTLHETADRSDTAAKVLIKDQLVPPATVKAPCTLDKPVKKKVPLGWSTTEAWPTTEPHNNEQPTGCRELQMNMTM
jgi:hypothetical protein